MLKPILLFASLALFASPATASTFIETKWEPKKSRAGEPIRFSVVVKTTGTDYIRQPDFPKVLTDWDIVRAYSSPSMRTTYENGEMTVKQENEFTYIIAPKRKGLLSIPSVEIGVGSKRLKTQAVQIQVDDVPIGAGSNRPPARMPAPRQPSFPDPNSPWGPGVGGLPRMEDLFDAPDQAPSPDTYNFEIPGDGRQTFFMRAHVKRTTVFVGEMIEVSYRAYTKSRALREAEITKFPEFKGFLKEDLYFPKVFDPQPVLIQGQPFFETELVRYALFPLRAGSLKIDQMTFKLRMASRDSLAQSLLFGTPFDGNVGTEIPMEKGSEIVQVLVKPLPIPKPTSFTGAVGQFTMEALAPPVSVPAGQPFSLIINIEGIGNLKSIEAPKLSFPKELDLTNMASHPSAIDETGSGKIQFEYLLNPREVGETQIAESEWSYFDPVKTEYVRLKIPAFAVKIVPGSGRPAAGADRDAEKTVKPREWMALGSPPATEHPTRISDVGAPMFFGSYTAFGLHLLVLVAFLTALWRRKHFEERAAFLKTYPWTHLEEELLNNRKYPARALSEKLDLWIRLRLVGYLKAANIEHALHSESSRADFADVLKQNLPPDFYKIVDSLKSYWAELDTMRFSGTTSSTEIASKLPFEKAKAVLIQMEKSLRKTDKKLYQGFQDEWSSN